MTLVSAVIGLAMIILGIIALVEVSGSLHMQDTRMAKRVGGEQLLASTVLEFEKLTSDRLTILCQTLDAFNKVPATKCLNAAGNDLEGSPVIIPGGPNKIGARMDWNGTFSAKGPFCVDLISCKWRGGEHMIEIVLNGIWIVPKGGNAPAHVANRQIVLRRVR